MSRRDKSLAAYVARMQRDEAGATDDPFAGVPPELAEAHLYGVTGGRWWNGWDGMHAGRVHINGDGHHTSHSSACAEAVEEPLLEKLIRMGNLEHVEAQLLRDIFAAPNDGNDTRAKRLGLTLRTYQRREAAIREGLARNLGHDPSERLRFDFVYWADLRYGEPVTAGRNREPYSPDPGTGPS